MNELIDTIGLCLSCFIVGYYVTGEKQASHATIIKVSLVCGFIFFLGKFIVDYKTISDDWLGLLMFSSGISLSCYLICIIDYFHKKKTKK